MYLHDVDKKTEEHQLQHDQYFSMLSNDEQ